MPDRAVLFERWRRASSRNSRWRSSRRVPRRRKCRVRPPALWREVVADHATAAVDTGTGVWPASSGDDAAHLVRASDPSDRSDHARTADKSHQSGQESGVKGLMNPGPRRPVKLSGTCRVSRQRHAHESVSIVQKSLVYTCARGRKSSYTAGLRGDCNHHCRGRDSSTRSSPT